MSEKWHFGVNICLVGILSFPFHMSRGSEVWAEINCSTGILFANLFFPLSNNYSKERIFHFPLVLACFGPGDPGRGHKGWLCFGSKGPSHCQGVPSTWET